MAEIIKELFGSNYNIYFGLFITISLILFTNIKINKENISMKVCLIYVLFYFLGLFYVIDKKVLLIIFIVVTFCSFEFIFPDKLYVNMVKKMRYVVIDYIYKIIFEYYFALFFISMFLTSKYFNQIVYKIMSYFNIVADEKIYFYVISLISCVLVLKTIIMTLNSEFDLYNFEEILDKMDKIVRFDEFKNNGTMIDFSNLLIGREDHSYFYREKTYNWISLEFVKYRLKRIWIGYTKYKISRIWLLRDIVFPLYLLARILHIICKKVIWLIKIVFKAIKRRKRIRNYFIGYSTIEMQLIRTLAVKSGYTSHPYRRKIFEFLYSNIFFTSLREYYEYNGMKTYKYKYYLLYIYMSCAPVCINGHKYNTILEMYNKDNLYDVTIEEFYIWMYGLSHCPITNNIINGYYRKEYKMDIIKLTNLINKYNK